MGRARENRKAQFRAKAVKREMDNMLKKDFRLNWGAMEKVNRHLLTKKEVDLYLNPPQALEKRLETERVEKEKTMSTEEATSSHQGNPLSKRRPPFPKRFQSLTEGNWKLDDGWPESEQTHSYMVLVYVMSCKFHTSLVCLPHTFQQLSISDVFRTFMFKHVGTQTHSENQSKFTCPDMLKAKLLAQRSLPICPSFATSLDKRATCLNHMLQI